MSYQKLCEIHDEIALLGSTQALLGWDQETFLPTKASAYRGKQLSYLSSKVHQLRTSTSYAEALTKAEDQVSDDAMSAANLREWRHQYENSSKLPTELVQRATEASSSSLPFWKEARESGDFSIFAPHFSKLLAIAKEKAELWGYEDDIYTALLSKYERGSTTTEVSALFDSCSSDLIQLASEATAKSTASPCRPLTGMFPIEKQQELNRQVAQSIGFDFEAGRIDTTTHPFCSGMAPHDVRLTTRYDENNFLPALFGVMHEAGHGMYEQGLNTEEYGRPAGSAVSLGIHESQSLLWENHVGRSEPFWQKWLPLAQELFPQLADWSVEDLLGNINHAKYSFIRVDADEATYDLHILLRFRLERMLLNDEIQVKDVPHVWNSLSEELFGMKPTSNSEGCLQDIHWAFGGLGYFATYSLGNFNASQLFHKATETPLIANACEIADYQPLLQWMQKNIHQSGSQLLPQDLIKKATGKGTDPTFHLNHLAKRFL